MDHWLGVGENCFVLIMADYKNNPSFSFSVICYYVIMKQKYKK